MEISKLHEKIMKNIVLWFKIDDVKTFQIKWGL